MAPHRCIYCLKPIATESGIKRHVMQSPACRDAWANLLDRMKSTISNDADNQLPEQTDNDVLDNPYEWEDMLDGRDGPDNTLDMPDGHLVHLSRGDVDNPGPPDLSERPSKRVRLEEDNEDLPHWPASGHFTEQYTGVAATILGKQKTVFESMEAAELERGESEWAPFRDEDEWELARFLMKNLGQMKVDELLKLSFVSE